MNMEFFHEELLVQYHLLRGLEGAEGIFQADD